MTIPRHHLPIGRRDASTAAAWLFVAGLTLFALLPMAAAQELKPETPAPVLKAGNKARQTKALIEAMKAQKKTGEGIPAAAEPESIGAGVPPMPQAKAAPKVSAEQETGKKPESLNVPPILEESKEGTEKSRESSEEPEEVTVETEIGPEQAVEVDLAVPSEARELLPDQERSSEPRSERLSSAAPAAENFRLNSEHVVRINRSLRAAIEENSRLDSVNRELDSSVKSLRGQRQIQGSRLITVGEERDRFKKELEALKAEATSDERDLGRIQQRFVQTEEGLDLEISDLQAKLAETQKTVEDLKSQLAASAAAYEEEKSRKTPKGFVKREAKLQEQIDQLKGELRQAKSAGIGGDAVLPDGKTAAELALEMKQLNEKLRSAEQDQKEAQSALQTAQEKQSVQSPAARVAAAQQVPVEPVTVAPDAATVDPDAAAAEPDAALVYQKEKKKSIEVLVMIEDMAKETARLKQDEAKIHYNMGNIFFRKGQYRKAVREYHQAIKILPEDANAHFNLAFVSGEYLQDPEVAVAHYREYLNLKPNAQDAAMVQEKIIEAELNLRTKLDSNVEKEWREFRATNPVNY